MIKFDGVHKNSYETMFGIVQIDEKFENGNTCFTGTMVTKGPVTFPSTNYDWYFAGNMKFKTKTELFDLMVRLETSAMYELKKLLSHAGNVK